MVNVSEQQDAKTLGTGKHTFEISLPYSPTVNFFYATDTLTDGLSTDNWILYHLWVCIAPKKQSFLLQKPLKETIELLCSYVPFVVKS